MTMWVWDELIKADIPEGWIVKESQSLIEILPPEPVGALQISIFKVPNGDLQALCFNAIENFVEKQDGHMCGDLRFEVRDVQAVVFGSFESLQSGRFLSWLIAAVGWQGRVALATYCYANKMDERVREAEAILASICPVP